MHGGRSRIRLFNAAARRTELHQEIPCHDQSAGGENHVAWQAHPLPKQSLVIERLAARPCVTVLVDRVELWPPDREEVEEDPHHKPAIVAPEGNPAGRFIELRTWPSAVAQTEVDQAERKQAEGAEQRSVRVIERQEGPCS